MRIDRARDALLLVDLQHDFLPGGALAVARGDEILEPIARAAPAFATVVATQDWHPQGHVSFASSHPPRRPFEVLELPHGRQELWPDHCVQGSPGAALHPRLPDRWVTLVLRKGTRPEVDSYSAFRENVGPDGQRPTTGLGAWLAARSIRRVFVAGLARDFCVRATALDAAAEGFEVVVLDDLTRAVFPERAAEVDAALAAAGVGRASSAELGGGARQVPHAP
ncbi:MAG TPA: bifunctional nicotinamidase/pyrazinamidase [Anaeromyxobacter sp.]|nr:bifunctional nicotinamidase/pyrazinamidase [Anaeromyxobacter sp.]